MSTLTWRVPGRNTNVTYKGFLEFEQCSAHLPTKNEFGVDDMVLYYTGAMPKLPAFLAGLKQGRRFDHNGRAWYLQTWTVSDDKLWPIVSLNCKGLAEGVLPVARHETALILQNITVNATISENAGSPDDPIDVQLTRDINYRCMQTTWYYVTVGEPNAAKFGTISKPFNPGILSSTITATDDFRGTRNFNGGNADAAYVTATFPATVDILLDLTSSQIYGTPYFEVAETVARMFFVG